MMDLLLKVMSDVGFGDHSSCFTGYQKKRLP